MAFSILLTPSHGQATSEHFREVPTFKDKLTQLMLRRGLSQRALAAALNDRKVDISQRAISGWFSGAAPRPESLVAVASFFNVPVELLTDDSKELPQTPFNSLLENLGEARTAAESAYPTNPDAARHLFDYLELEKRTQETAQKLLGLATELTKIASHLDPLNQRIYEAAQELQAATKAAEKKTSSRRKTLPP